jgi:hypothetical protein
MKKFVFVISIILLFINKADAQNLQWRWSNSSFDVTPEANATHFIGSAFLADALERKGMEWWQADLTALGLGLMWEIKDGFVPYETVPVFGAEGFSKMDLATNVAGVVLNRVVNVGLEKLFKLSRKSKEKQPDPSDIYY